MHEFSLATQILEVALEAADEHGSDEVISVQLSMDPDTHLDQGILVAAFHMAAAGSPAADARLEVQFGAPGSGELAVTAVDVRD